jgi:hypothetical protein
LLPRFCGFSPKPVRQCYNDWLLGSSARLWLLEVAKLSLVVAAVTAQAACGGSTVFACVADHQCGADGRCEASSFCSFPDDACESGRRYAPLSPDDLAGTCVPLDAAEGTSSTVGTDDAPDPSTDASGEASSASTVSTTASSTSSSTSSNTDAVTSDATTMGLDGSEGATETTNEPDGRVLEGLIAFYPLDEGRGATVYDQSGFDPAIDLGLTGEGFTWTATGLHTTGVGIVLAQGSAGKIVQACQATNELTVEAWFTPEYSVQPLDTQAARLVTYSSGTSYRNFMLGQGASWNFGMMTGEGFTGRLRTSDPDAENGGGPPLYVEVVVPTAPQHVVYTRRANGLETLYRDGELIATQSSKTGDFSAWSAASSFKLALGNEIGLERPFLGELHLVAVYERALTEAEVEKNFEAGY